MLLLASVFTISILIFQLVFASSRGNEANFFDVTKDVKIIARPTALLDGLTDSLTLRCSFGPTSGGSTLLAMIVSKTGPSSRGFRELAAISSHSPKTVDEKDALGADVTGHISATENSFIEAEWKNPGSDLVGTYICEAHSLVANGYPRISTASVEVKQITHVDSKEILQIIKSNQMKRTQEELKLRESMEKMQSQMSHVKELLTSSSITFASRKYRNHTYYMSGPMTRNSPLFEIICGLYGGYLAELNDDGEYNFMSKLILEDLKISERVALGATDDDHEGKWTWMRSGNPMDYEHWSGTCPNGGTKENCLYWEGNVRLIDDECFDNMKVRFVCEVEP